MCAWFLRTAHAHTTYPQFATISLNALAKACLIAASNQTGWELEKRVRFPMEGAQLLARGLYCFAPVVNRTEHRETVFARDGRTAPPDVVRKPVSVSREDQMLCNHNLFC